MDFLLLRVNFEAVWTLRSDPTELQKNKGILMISPRLYPYALCLPAGDKVCVYDAGKYWYRAIVKAALDSSYTSSALPPSTPGLDVFVELLDYGSTLWVAKEK